MVRQYPIVGSITKEADVYYNSAMPFTPNKSIKVYHKRALWGWDRDNFCEGGENGIFEIEELKIGVRICFEVRFSEFFRKLRRNLSD